MKKVHADFKEFRDNSPEAQLKNLQKKLIREVVTEITTPLARNFNVDHKKLKKLMDESVQKILDHEARLQTTDKFLVQIEQNLLTQLKNNDSEAQALKYELNRMQHLDRLKVKHARDSFFNPDIGSLLPSLDMAHASYSTALSQQTPY